MLATLAKAILTLDLSVVSRRIRRGVISYAIAGLALLIGLGFLLAAAFIVAAREFGTLYASLGFGAGFIILAVIVLTIQAVVSRAEARRRARELKSAELKSLVTATALSMLPVLMKHKGGVLSALMPIAAMAAYSFYKRSAPEDERDPD